MVFYGTETSVDLDDELDRDKPLPPVVHQEAIQNNVAPDARQNAVDTEGDPWTGSQQVNRVSHPEVQRPTTENQTSGCATFETGGGGGCLGGCLILLLLAYLTTGGVPGGWRRELMSSRSVSSTDGRDESSGAKPGYRPPIATAASTMATSRADATTTVGGRCAVPATGCRSPEARVCS